MKYTIALAALAGIAAAQPHMGHQRLHKKAAMKTVTDLTVVTVTDVVTVYGPSPAPEPTKAADPPAAPAASSQAAASSAPAAVPSPPAAVPSPPAPSASDQPKAANTPAPPAPAPAPASSSAAASSPAAPPAPAQSSSAPSGGSGGGSGVGKYGLMPGATAPADCTEDQPCKEGMTTYATGLGACGYDDSAPNDQDVVALQKDMFGSLTNTGPNAPANKLCNKKIQIKNPATGVTATGVIRDRCVGCTGSGGIDLSPPLWAKLNNNQPGNRVPVEWYFLD